MKRAIALAAALLASSVSGAVYYSYSTSTSTTVALSENESREFCDLSTYWYPQSISTTTTGAHIFRVQMPDDEEIQIQIKCSSVVQASFIGIDFFDFDPTQRLGTPICSAESSYSSGWEYMGRFLSQSQLGKTYWIRFHYEKQNVGYGTRYSNALSVRLCRGNSSSGTGEDGPPSSTKATVSFNSNGGSTVSPR